MAIGDPVVTRHEDGALEIDATPKKHVYYFGGEEMHDFAVTARVKFLSAADKYSGFSLYLRWNGEVWGERDGFWVYLRPKFRSLFMQKVADGKLDEEFAKRVEAVRPGAVPVGEWLDLRCEARGRKIEVYLNDELHLSATDEGLFPILSGRMAFGVGDAQVIVADITQTNLEQSEKITGVTYEYLSKPTRGDENATILTDGKVNAREQQAFWRMLGPRPEIVFDLGKEYFVSRVVLRAISSPAVNIASAEIQGATGPSRPLAVGAEGKPSAGGGGAPAGSLAALTQGLQWQTLAVLRNEDGRRAEAEHEVAGPVRRVARYVKVVLNRPAADQDVELAEVELYGREPTEEDRLAAAASAYEIGPEMPPTTDAERHDEHFFYLTGEGIRVAVDRVHGLVGGIWKREHAEKCLERLADKYYLLTREEDVEAGEYDDRVEEVLEDRAGGPLRLRCSNPKLPDVTIEKTYTLSPDGRRLIKRVAFVSTSDAPDRFLTPAVGGLLTEDFRRGGVYMGCDRGLGARLFAEEVTVPRQIGALGARNAKVVIFERYDLGWGLAQYRYKVNDHYCRPLTSRWHEKANHPPIYLPNGWEFGVATLHLAPKQEQSIETQLALFEGRQYDFYGMYRNLPEVAEAFASVQRPEWVRDLKTGCNVALNPLTEDLTGPLMPVQRSLQMTETGGLWNLTHIHGVWGEWFTEGVVTNGYGAKIDTQWLKDYIAAVQRMSPRVKVGVYTWAWAVHPRSKAYREHPEWFITTDRDGQVFNAYSNMVLNHARRFSIAESMDELMDQFARVMTDFKGDFFYLDGGGGGQNLIDWEHLACDQDYDYQELYRRIREVTRACGDDKAVWFNARTGPYWDIGYYEGIDRMLHAATWRDSADGLSAVKIRQAYDPGQVVVPLYWRASTLPFFSNYCIGLGITPSRPLGADDQREKLPFIEAAYETRGLRWIEADLEPDWRVDPETQIEAYALKEGEAAFISVIDHREDAGGPAVVSADTEKLGLDAGRPVYAWTFGVRDIREAWPALPEATRREVYRQTGWGLDLVARLLGVEVIEKPGGRIELEIPTEPHLLRMVMLSNSPAGVFSVGELRTNFWKPTNLGASVHAELSAEGGQMVVEATAPDAGAEIIVCPPPGKVVNPGKGALKPVFVGERKLVILSVPAGEHRLELAVTDAPPMDAELKVSCPEEVAAGETLEVATEPPTGSAQVSLCRGDVLVFGGEVPATEGVLRVAVPEQVHGGELEVRVAAAGAQREMVTGKAGVKITGDFEPELVPVALPKRGPKLEIAEVNKTVKGIKVLSAGTDTHDGYDGGLFAQVEAERLTIAGGNLDAPRSRYGYGFGGLELEGARVLTLRVSNTFHEAWTYYRSRVSYHPKYTSTFCGVMVDYHTEEGYTRRVALGLGLINPKRKAPRPGWGTKAPPDEFISLGDVIHEGGETEVTIDLARWAPAGWDGRCWLAAGADNVLPSRRIYVQILDNADTPEGKEIIEGEAMGDLYKIRSYRVCRMPAAPAIDGKLADEAWRELKPVKDFGLLGRMGSSTQATRAWLAYDDEKLYVAFDCPESEKQQLNTAAKKIWNQDAIDFALDVDGDREDFQQIIVNCKGEFEQFSQGAGGEKTVWQIEVGVAQYEGGWSVEVAIPWSEIGAKPSAGMKWTGNFVRYRPYPPTDEMQTWSAMPGPAVNEAARFGDMVFE